MPNTEETLQVIEDPRVRQVLVRLHREAGRQNASLAWRFASQLPRLVRRRPLRWDRLEPKLSDMYLALDPAAGVFGYLLARSLQARRIVEFGTSFGISTIYLALAVRENGGGCVIGTEMVPEKAARAREHLTEAGLDAFVEIREGDALETLRHVDDPVDMLLNDGFPRFTLLVLQLVACALERWPYAAMPPCFRPITETTSPGFAIPRTAFARRSSRREWRASSPSRGAIPLK